MAKINVSDELKKYGYVFSKKKTAIELFLVFGAVISLGMLFSLDLFYEIVLGVICLLFLPLFLRNSAKSRYVQKRFSDINVYIEQFLYSFEKTGKILDTLRDVREIFEDGLMLKKIDMAITHIENSYDSTSEEDALGIIEREYRYEGLSIIHKFALNVEKEGGEYRRSAHILLEDRRRWMERNIANLNEKRRGRVKVLMSIVMTLLICFLIYFLGRNMDVDISKKPLVQFGTTLVLVLDLCIYYLTDCKFSKDYLTEKKDNGYALKLQRKWEDSSRKRTGIQKFRYNMDKKVIVREIEKEFPSWILSISLLLQNDNVQVSITKSYDSAPLIMKNDLKKLIEELKTNPTGIKPYISFMEEYGIPDIESSMKVLYSLSENGNGSAVNEMGEILERNRTMIDRSAKLKNEDEMSGMVALFLAPQLTAGFKMLIDMMVMFTMYFSDFTNVLK